MMRRTVAAITAGFVLLACSGRYEGGSMGKASNAGAFSVAGTSTVAAGGSVSGSPMMAATDLGGSAAGGASSGTAGQPTDAPCADLGEPAPIGGSFATPDVMWNRIAMLTYGTIAVQPSPLPDATTYAWAGQMAEDATLMSGRVVGGAGGVDLVLKEWLDLPATAKFQGAWSQLVPGDAPVLQVLLQTPMAETGHHGIFGEPAWLMQYPNISSRGGAVSAAVLDAAIPPPPAGITSRKPDPSLTDRQSLAYELGGEANCMGCHQLMDPLGYMFGHFDAVGTYRATDKGQDIDATGTTQLRIEGRTIAFDGPKEFGLQVADTCDAAMGIADGFLRAAMVLNQQVGPNAQRFGYDEEFEANAPRIRQAFIHGGRTYTALVKAYAQSPLGLRP